MNPFLNLVAGERYLFQASGNRTFIATFVNRLNTTILLTKYSDTDSRMCGGVYSYTTNDILDAFPLSELIPGQKYRFWYLEKINDENRCNVEPEYYRKSREGVFVEVTDPVETLRYDTRENPEHLRMWIVSCPLHTIIQIDKL
jgi:hypothetical protein